jgi:hypothetical protein
MELNNRDGGGEEDYVGSWNNLKSPEAGSKKLELRRSS